MTPPTRRASLGAPRRPVIRCGERRVLVVPYDDLNPFLDCFKSKVGGGRESDDAVLQRLVLSDHMDAILSVAVGEVVGEVIEGTSPAAKACKRLDRQHRTTLAL